MGCTSPCQRGLHCGLGGGSHQRTFEVHHLVEVNAQAGDDRHLPPTLTGNWGCTITRTGFNASNAVGVDHCRNRASAATPEDATGHPGTLP